MNLSFVIDLVVSMVHCIHFHGFNHHFCEFLSEIEAKKPDLPYHTEVQWLSSNELLLKFFELRAKTEIFLNEKEPLSATIIEIEYFRN